jgi:peptidoglycan/LPS O-acetylase OafA/YrhL
LRALAIVAVMGFHVMQMSPQGRIGWTVLQHGHVGVDLFFVLSGWLIGGLYWKEQARQGAVALWSFWQRRWWRTIPAYMVAALLSWLAVFAARREAFDPGYLLFLQNYYEAIPYFLVSWSLCIEEHFYLALPLAVWLFGRVRLSTHLLFAVLVALPLVLRTLHVEQGYKAAFGFYRTATHLHCEGLVLGFWASRLVLAPAERFARVRRLAGYALVALAPTLVWLLLGDARRSYVWLPTATATCFLSLLLTRVGVARDGRSSGVIYAVAVSSYSLYLTHALVIHVARALALKVGALPYSYLVLATLLIGAVGATFYRLVERPSMLLRERFSPARGVRTGQALLGATEPSPALERRTG